MRRQTRILNFCPTLSKNEKVDYLTIPKTISGPSALHVTEQSTSLWESNAGVWLAAGSVINDDMILSSYKMYPSCVTTS